MLASQVPENNVLSEEREAQRMVFKAEREVAYAPEMEKAVLASIMCFPDTILPVVQAALEEEDFFVPANRVIYSAFLDLQFDGIKIDLPTVHQHLVSRKLAEQVGSPGCLSELLGGFATNLNIGAYITGVKTKSVTRKIMESARAILQSVSDGDVEEKDLLAHAETLVLGIRQKANIHTITTMEVASEQLWQRLLEMKRVGKPLDVIKTGYSNLDDIIKGFRPNQFIVVAARPGKGKSAMAGNLSSNMCSQNPPVEVGVISLEMGVDEWLERIYAHEARINLNRMDEPMHDWELDRIEEAKRIVSAWPLFIDATNNHTTESLSGMARQMVATHKIKILFIDYIQLIKDTSSKFEREQINNITRTLKQLSRELKIPIVAMAQLNRDMSKEGREPELHDLKGSGSLEQDADTVILLHWEGEGGTSGTFDAIWKVAKQRRGRRDKANMTYLGPNLRFIERKV